MRVEHPGAVWHSKDRGHRREDILFDDVDRQDFKQMGIDLMAGELGENPTAQSGSALQPEGGEYRGSARSHLSELSNIGRSSLEPQLHKHNRTLETRRHMECGSPHSTPVR